MITGEFKASIVECDFPTHWSYSPLGLAGADGSIAMDVLEEDVDDVAVTDEDDDDATPTVDEPGPGLEDGGSDDTVFAGAASGDDSGRNAAGDACVGDCTDGLDLWSGTWGGASTPPAILGRSQGRS